MFPKANLIMQTIKNDIQFSWDLYYTFEERYKENALNRKMFKHSEMIPLILKRNENNIFKIEKIGSSAELRDIYLVSVGHGKTKVLLWSQMHGDESTATMTIFDIFNFFSADDEFNSIRKKILDKLTLYFIPMLNPDGAERFQRRNALNIDLNRDALKLQSPESAILKNIRDRINPEFGFNLHDQCSRYSVGTSFKSAAISFLAPPYDNGKEVNDVRKKAMQLIVFLNKILSCYIPGHIAKYDDDFEIRAFGDNIQKWGTSTILIESGGWYEDFEKQFIRKLNFIALLSSFKCLSEGRLSNLDINEYELIPENDKYLFDLILRNITYTFGGSEYTIDIGINREEEHSENGEFFFRSTIEDIGDLSVFHGIEELDCTGMSIEPAKTHPDKFSDIDEITKLNVEKLFNEGITIIHVLQDNIKDEYTRLPLIIQTPKAQNTTHKIEVEDLPNLIIKKDNRIRYVIINGFVYDILTGTNNIYNGLILS